MRLLALRTDELGSDREAALRAMLWDAWADKHDVFTETDWVSATGGTHLILEDDDGTIVSHASIVDRVLETGGRSLATGYVEAVATAPAFRLQGHASTVMWAVGEVARRPVRAGRARHRVPRLLRAVRLGAVGGTDDGAHRARRDRHAGRGRRGDGADDADDAGAGPAGADQLRLAPRRRVVKATPAQRGIGAWSARSR